MSLDFRNRNDWLKVRATPVKSSALDYLHVSKRIVTIRTPEGTLRNFVDPSPGVTFNVGNNKKKKERRHAS